MKLLYFFNPIALHGTYERSAYRKWTSWLAAIGACLVGLAVEPVRADLSAPTQAGVVVAWGSNASSLNSVPSGLSNAVQIAAGSGHNLALKSDGSVLAWGSNAYGQTSVPSGLGNVVQIAGGFGHSLALKSDGSVVAWGYNAYGQSSVPSGLSNVVQIAGGLAHSLALKSDGSVVAWGSNSSGQSSVPSGLGNVVQIAAGDSHSLALKSNGSVVAWGSNGSGQTTVPSGLGNVVQIATGGSHSLALKSDGSVVAWGSNAYGQTTVPSGLSNVVEIAGGSQHSLALKSDGSVVAWGRNIYGESSVPSGLSNVMHIAAGFAHNLALVRLGPVITVEQPQGTNLPDGGSKSFGNVVVGVYTSLSFTIKNTGNADLTGLTVTRDGTHAAMFTVTANPAASVSGPNGSTTFTVRFTPTSAGTKTAAIHIASNVTGSKNPYDITLTGTGTTSVALPVSLAVQGPAIVSAGGSASYTCAATFSDGSTGNLTSICNWSATGGTLNDTGLGRAVFESGTLTAGLASSTNPVLITASYTTAQGRLTSPTRSVIIGDGNTLGVGIGLGVDNGRYLRPSGNGFVWQLSAVASGQAQTAPGVVWQWYVDGILDNVTTNSYSKEISGLRRSVELKVVATDSQGRTGTDSRTISLQYPALNEPGQKYRANQPTGATLLDAQGNPLVFDATRISHGLIVLTHGMTDGPNASWLTGPTGLATAIENRLLSENKPVPTIAIFGWEQGANPLLHDIVSSDTTLAARVLKVDANILAGVPYLGEFIFNTLAIKPDAGAYAIKLAEWVQNEATLGHINVSKPIHFIGHSAGGFVVGGGAYWLKRSGVATVAQVTMLDTPLPDRDVFTTLMNPTVMERYVSSAFGACAPDLGERPSILATPIGLLIDPYGIKQLANALPQGQYYQRQILTHFFDPIAGPNIPFKGAHNYSHDWYIRTADGTANEAGGFVNSPFMTGQTPAPALAPPSAEATASRGVQGSMAPASPASTAAPLGGFSTFGNVTGSGSPYVLTEDTNAGIQQAMTLPVGAESLQFRYQFTSAGDGDFIAVYFGDNPPLFIGLDVAAARSAPMPVNVPLQGYEGQSGNLVITLVSQGQTNAVVQIDQIQLITNDDPDHDGLTTAQEIALGTDPLKYDTDGDGISDGDEVNIYHTNPLMADTDGDGISDGAEMAAGTDPLDPKSNFKVVAGQLLTNGSFVLNWSAITGKTYRVLRSATPSFADYDVIATGVAPVANTGTYTDSTIPPGTKAMFYRAQTE